MSWLRIALSEEELKIVRSERESHPDLVVRRRLQSLWLLNCGLTREKAAEILDVAVSTVKRDVSLYRTGGVEALRKSERTYLPTSALAVHREAIRASLEQQPARTIAEACQRIKDLTGIDRKPTQVRRFLKDMGLRWQRVRAIPVPPKKTWKNTSSSRLCFSTKN